MRTIGRRQEQHDRGYLPHLERGGADYFLTFSALIMPQFSAAERDIVMACVRFGHPERWMLHGAVVMPDHVHMLLAPADIQGKWLSLAEIVRSVKGVSARRINQSRGTRGPVWMSEYYDRIVRDQADFDVKIEYMKNNPIKRGLVARPEDWDALWINAVR
jgi:REP element-mobilizing transposase RayT